MISKFIFVTILFYYLAKVSTPPNKIKSTFQDVYKREGIIGTFMYFLRVFGVFQLSMIYGFYVFLMYQQEYSGKPEFISNDLPRLSKWENTFIVVSILKIIGIALRLWCYKTLAEFFTFDITINKHHKLITHGPYRYLIHPSYAALLFLWPYLSYLASQFPPFIKLYESSLSPMTYSIFSFTILTCHPSSIVFKILITLTIIAMSNRMIKEEVMLKDHFGKEWDNYVKTRWRLIPYLI
ncbi:hypothetical protein Glove_18g40 [Diversispora epigaea]|uniref:Protein-S-isoprenylcysteine O-methyltransferase n=1 Tax=Diversispora epigaea TaxID=1348612 RepID=A0A397JQQ8_9GLOM|nr:hypothetical protein Glove_18g40 [Diversispora epigaea]